MTDLLLTRSASISSCGRYRYWLERVWDDRPTLTFVMLNPSTADAEVDDPTIRRCIGFGRREGAGGIVVVNLFALRATYPAELLTDDARFYDPDNFEAGVRVMHDAIDGKSKLVCAWGANKLALAEGRDFVSRAVGVRCFCLGKTKEGFPRHPLYVSANQPLEPYP